jgi:hypothetical protein
MIKPPVNAAYIKESKIIGHCSSRSLDNFAALNKHLRNLLVLMRQQSEGVSDVVPLPLALGTRKSRG